ncbi:VOC family protein [Arthrobacter mobilis]|uniref:VOC family protein n=1 Tax=Arthrobacter mobilis TaxID=2724944 RepID=A0A7X6HBQ4_9MICC|nr:VOC family protein [Arthrobacter mobilis]NKX53208.1 VOC family protein [Arthrobacter mobilis]
MIGTWQALVIDCADPDKLATFYEQLLGMIRVQHAEGWISIGDAPDRPAIAFQQVDDYEPPQWPGQEHPQQMHIDVKVRDLDIAEELVLQLGATSMDSGTGTFRVYVDPAGHPFCLVQW